MKLFIVCKHPESNQSTHDLIDYLRKEPKFTTITVYGVQNTTQSKSRILHDHRIRFLDVDDNGNKLDIDVLNKELTTTKYDIMIIIHTINIVATIAKSLEQTLETLSMKTLLYCEIPREFPHKRYFNGLKSVVDNHKLHGKIRLATPSKQGNDLMDKWITNHMTTILPYGIEPGLFYPIPRDVARAAIEYNDSDMFIVFCVGRIDTSILTFADFVGQNPSVKAKLMLPIDESLGENVKEFYINEMGNKGVDEDAALQMLVLLKDVSFMNNEELNVIVCSANVVLHANPVSDFNIYVSQFALTNTPQIIADIYFNTEYIDKRYIAKVNTVFDFYSFDDYGGRLSLCSHKEFSNALSSIYNNYNQAELNARLLNSNAFAQQLDWRNWRTALEDLHHHSLRINERDEEIKPDYTNEIDSLKKKLQNILLKINK